MMAGPFYDARTRTFRPFCRQALATMALGPLVAGLIFLIMAMLP